MSLIGSFSRGSVCGLAAGTGIVLARWLTWEPYAPWLIPYDLVPIVVFGGLLFVPLALSGLPSGIRRSLLPLATAVLVAVLATAWGQSLVGTDPGTTVKLLAGFAFLAGAGLAVFGWVRQRSGLSPEWLLLGVAIALAVSIEGYGHAKGWILLFPTALVVLLLPGIPASTGGNLRFLPRSMAILIPVGCALVPPAAPDVSDLHCGDRQGESVLLIVLDTLRSDHLSLYGYDRPTTPRLDRWAKEALVFEDVTAVSSWTLPTHASMFTGFYPRSHGAYGFVAPRGFGNAYPLKDEHTTLAELASDAGFCTGAISSNWFFLAPRFNLDQGFLTYDARRPRAPFRFGPAEWLARRFHPDRYEEIEWGYYRDRHTTDRAIRWLDAFEGRSFFLFLNYLDPHEPNHRPASAAFPATGERAPVEKNLDLQEQAHAGAVRPDVLRYLINNYDREIRHLDQEVARLLDFLESSGRADTTTVIITSDHGEFLGEHRLLFHPGTLYQPVVRVPLMIKGRGIPAGRTSRPVQSVDLFPTILDRLGVSYDPDATQGVAVFEDVTRPIVAEWHATPNSSLRDPRFGGRFERSLQSIRSGRWNLYEYEDGMVELYDLRSDPGERHEISDQRPETVARLREELRSWRERHPPETPSAPSVPEISPGGLEKLRSLGYAH